REGTPVGTSGGKTVTAITRIIHPLLFVVLLSPTLSAQTRPHEQRARAIYRELVEIDTADTANGNVTKAAEAMAERLRAAGFPLAEMQLIGPDPKKHNLVLRWRGTGAQRPVLLLAHLDVVQANREEWSFDPFTFLEQDGFFYG